MLEAEWNAHVSGEKHDDITVDRDREDNVPIPASNATDTLPTRMVQDTTDRLAQVSRNVASVTTSALPDLFFDDVSPSEEEDLVDDESLNAPLSEDRRSEIEQNIRAVMSKRGLESITGSDDDDLDWRRKRI